LCGRGGRPVGIRIGGFNLLPYRQRLSRGRRRRLIIEAASAVLLGVLGALAWTAWDAFGPSGPMRREAELRAILAGFAAPLAEYRRLERASADIDERMAVAAELAKPYKRFLGVVDALSRVPLPDVALSRLELTGEGIDFDAAAADSESATAWIESLARAGGVRTAEIVEWKSAAGAASHALELAARLQWEQEVPAGRSSRADSSRGRR
jgi:type IV pilus assembly protein PilN